MISIFDGGRMSKHKAQELAAKFQESQEDLRLAAKLDDEDMAKALVKFRADYAQRRREIIIREVMDAYY